MDLDLAYSEAPTLAADAAPPHPNDLCAAYAEMLAGREETPVSADARCVDMDPDLCGVLAVGDAYAGLVRERTRLQATIEQAVASRARADALVRTIRDARAELAGIVGGIDEDDHDAWSRASDAELKDSRREADDLDERMARMRRAISGLLRGVVDPERVEKKLCPVCFDREVDTCCVPCGHTLCKRCAARVPTRAPCPTCRADVNDRIRIYFSV